MCSVKIKEEMFVYFCKFVVGRLGKIVYIYCFGWVYKEIYFFEIYFFFFYEYSKWYNVKFLVYI